MAGGVNGLRQEQEVCDVKVERRPIGSICKAILLARVSLNSDVFVQHYQQFSGKKAERVA